MLRSHSLSTIKKQLVAPLRTLSRQIHAIKNDKVLRPIGMKHYRHVQSLEALLRTSGTATWDQYPAMRMPRHEGFRRELCHETATSSIPRWMLEDSGASVPPVSFASIDAAILWPFEGVAMMRSGKVVAESAFTLQERSPDLLAMPGTHVVSGKTHVDLRKVVVTAHIDDPVLLSGNGWNQAFGHWIYDTMTSLYTCRDALQTGKLKAVFASLKPWQKEWLQLLDIPDDAIIEVKEGHITAEKAIVASSLSVQNVHYPSLQTVDLLTFLRSLARSEEGNNPYIYLSRASLGKSSHRTLVNEQAIIDALADIGVQAIVPESMSAMEQVNVFAQARVIIGPVGSAFALSGLAAEGACVIEILPSQGAHTWMFRSSANVNHWYGCIMADTVPDSEIDLDAEGVKRAGWYYSYTADPDILRIIAKRAIEISKSQPRHD